MEVRARSELGMPARHSGKPKAEGTVAIGLQPAAHAADHLLAKVSRKPEPKDGREREGTAPFAKRRGRASAARAGDARGGDDGRQRQHLSFRSFQNPSRLGSKKIPRKQKGRERQRRQEQTCAAPSSRGMSAEAGDPQTNTSPNRKPTP